MASDLAKDILIKAYETWAGHTMEPEFEAHIRDETATGWPKLALAAMEEYRAAPCPAPDTTTRTCSACVGTPGWKKLPSLVDARGGIQCPACDGMGRVPV